ncbi:MAG: hypothetical protein ACFFD2_27405, partial [Promethearchaeota archaeon]
MALALAPAFCIKIKLKDGSEAFLRPMRRNDEGMVLKFFNELSDEARYYRFFCVKKTMSREEIKQYVNIYYEDIFALGA